MKMSLLGKVTIATGAALLTAANPISAQTLFSDNFDYASPLNNAAPGYTVNQSRTDGSSSVIFGYDYSVPELGIPSAPNSVGGSQLGVRFDVNTSGTLAASAVISPTLSFPGDITLRFDLWMNTVGPFPAGGAGSTEHMTAGVGYNGTTFQNAASASGVWFAASGEGGSSGTSTLADFHARIGTTFQGPTTGIYAAGTTTGNPGSSVDNANAYYSTRFAGQAPPVAQQTAFPTTQTGTGANGSLIFDWHEVEVTRIGNTATWHIDGELIATVTNAAVSANDGVFVGYWDGFNSVAGNLAFGVIDNLSVTVVPEPSTIFLGLMGGLSLLFLVRRRK